MRPETYGYSFLEEMVRDFNVVFVSLGNMVLFYSNRIGREVLEHNTYAGT